MSTLLKLTVSDYDRVIASGVFSGDRRVELIHGELREMNPINPPHEDSVDFLLQWSVMSESLDRVRVRIQNSVGLPTLDSVPQPDVAWMRFKRYRKVRPTAKDVFLLIEVADSSVEYDCGEKADLYAAAGIQDYWVVNIPERCVVVFRKPVRGRYTQRTSYGPGEYVRPLAFPKVGLNVADLFATR